MSFGSIRPHQTAGWSTSAQARRRDCPLNRHRRQGAALRINGQMTVLMSLNNSEDAFLGDHLGTVGARDWPALFRCQFVGALGWDCAAWAHRPHDMRHPPNAVLVGDKKMISLPGEAIGLVQVFDVTINRFGVTLADDAQKSDVARALLGTRMSPFASTSRRGGLATPGAISVAAKPVGNCSVCPLYGTSSGLSVTIGPVFGAGRSAASMWYCRPVSCSAAKLLLSSLSDAGLHCTLNVKAKTPTTAANSRTAEVFDE